MTNSVVLPQDRVTGLRGQDRWHALAWVFGIGVPLWLIPIGIVSGDGLAQSTVYAASAWRLNPNHLLLEPLGAFWLAWLHPLLPERAGPDILKLLSVTSGALAAGLFRWMVVPAVVEGAVNRNLGTAWFVLSAGFLAHLVSDETHMIQMPWLVLTAAAALVQARRGTWLGAFALGAASGMAALSFVANAVLAAAVASALVLWWARHGSLRRSLGIAGGWIAGMVATVGFGLWLAWWHTAAREIGWPEWVVSYGGGGGGSRAATAFGAEWTPAGLAVAGARAVFGAASAVVDQGAGILLLRGIEHRPAEAGLAVVVLGTAIGYLGRAVYGLRHAGGMSRAWLTVLVAWIAGVLAFACYWSNSDGQFYFQLAVPVGTLASIGAGRVSRRAVVAVSAVVLGWNVITATRTQILYPRQAQVAALASVSADAALVVLPGWDVIEQMLFFVPPGSVQRLSIMSLADRVPSAEGLARLDSAVTATVNRGGQVVAIGILGANPAANPWRFLAALGYDHSEVERVLVQGRAVRTGQSGPFPVAWITAREAEREPPGFERR